MAEAPAGKRVKTTSDDLSLTSIVGGIIGAYVGSSGHADLTIDANEPDRGGWTLRKIWLPGSAPVIEIIKRRFTGPCYDQSIEETVAQTLQLTPANSAWAAGWLVDTMEELLQYKSPAEGGKMHSSIDATLTIFDLPSAAMRYYGMGSMPVWTGGFQSNVTEAEESVDVAKLAHTYAQEAAYAIERAQRLRSMARTWAQVSAAAVMATT